MLDVASCFKTEVLIFVHMRIYIVCYMDFIERARFTRRSYAYSATQTTAIIDPEIKRSALAASSIPPILEKTAQIRKSIDIIFKTSLNLTKR